MALDSLIKNLKTVLGTESEVKESEVKTALESFAKVVQGDNEDVYEPHKLFRPSKKAISWPAPFRPFAALLNNRRRMYIMNTNGQVDFENSAQGVESFTTLTFLDLLFGPSVSTAERIQHILSITMWTEQTIRDTILKNMCLKDDDPKHVQELHRPPLENTPERWLNLIKYQKNFNAFKVEPDTTLKEKKLKEMNYFTANFKRVNAGYEIHDMLPTASTMGEFSNTFLSKRKELFASVNPLAFDALVEGLGKTLKDLKKQYLQAANTFGLCENEIAVEFMILPGPQANIEDCKTHLHQTMKEWFRSDVDKPVKINRIQWYNVLGRLNPASLSSSLRKTIWSKNLNSKKDKTSDMNARLVLYIQAGDGTNSMKSIEQSILHFHENQKQKSAPRLSKQGYWGLLLADDIRDEDRLKEWSNEGYLNPTCMLAVFHGPHRMLYDSQQDIYDTHVCKVQKTSLSLLMEGFQPVSDASGVPLDIVSTEKYENLMQQRDRLIQVFARLRADHDALTLELTKNILTGRYNELRENLQTQETLMKNCQAQIEEVEEKMKSFKRRVDETKRSKDAITGLQMQGDNGRQVVTHLVPSPEKQLENKLTGNYQKFTLEEKKEKEARPKERKITNLNQPLPPSRFRKTDD